MVRAVVTPTSLALACALSACTPAHAPAVRSAGKWMALGGVAGIVGSALTTSFNDHAGEMLIGFEVITAAGVLSYAYAELTWPRVHYIEETPEQKHQRWAKILTERASGAAREGRCARVRRLEVRVQRYDRVVHDLVFMKDPEILRCLAAPAGTAPPAERAPPAEALPAEAPPAEAPPPAEAAPPAELPP